METWVLYALLSMLFAGFTSVLAKVGLSQVHPDVGLMVRTTTIFVLVIGFALATRDVRSLGQVPTKHLWLLVASGVTTALSWIFYYRAVKDGLVAYVAAIDKGSIVITLFLSYFILKEPLSLRLLLGVMLMLSGLLVLTWKF